MGVNRFFGEFMKKIREEKNISQKKLCESLCKVNLLSKIERGCAEADYFLLSALLERLGISLDKFGLILDNKEYQILQKRDKIERELVKGNHQEVRHLLQEYKNFTMINVVQREQYIQKINAILLVEESGDYENGIALLKNTIVSTINISFNSHAISSFLSLEEMRLLLLLSDFYFESGKLEFAKELIQELLTFVENTKIDKENMVKIYPAVVYYLGRIALLEGEKERASEFVVKGIYLLTKDGRISWLPQLLRLQIEIGNRMEINCDLLEQKRKILQVLEEIEQEFSGQVVSFCPLYQTLITHEIYLNIEAIRNTRLARKLSQSKAAENICNIASLARMEIKQQQPGQKMLQAFSDKLEMKGTRFYTSIETEKFELHEKRWELDKMLALNQTDEARILFLELKKRLETEHSVLNQQYLLFVDTMLQYEAKGISQEEALISYEKAYFLTAIEKNYLDKITEPLTKQEGYLLNQIAFLYYRKGDCESALKVTKNILDTLKASSVEIKYYYRLFSMLVMQLAGTFEVCENYREAKKLYKEGIMVALKNGRGNLLAKFLSEYAYAIEQEMKSKKNYVEQEVYEKHVRQSFVLRELFLHKSLEESESGREFFQATSWGLKEQKNRKEFLVLVTW